MTAASVQREFYRLEAASAVVQRLALKSCMWAAVRLLLLGESTFSG